MILLEVLSLNLISQLQYTQKLAGLRQRHCGEVHPADLE